MDNHFGILLVIGCGIGLFLAIFGIARYHQAESLKSANRKLEYLESDEYLLGKFDFNVQEWKYAYRMEFVEAQKGKPWLHYSGTEIYEDIAKVERDEIPGTISFFPDQIIINNGHCSKTYRFQGLNFLGYGIKMLSADMADTSFMKTLEIKVRIITGEDDLIEDHKILIPASARQSIDGICKFYQQRSDQ